MRSSVTIFRQKSQGEMEVMQEAKPKAEGYSLDFHWVSRKRIHISICSGLGQKKIGTLVLGVWAYLCIEI